MQFDPNVPFQDLPPLPPAQDVETRAVLKEVIGAAQALAALDAACSRLPNPDLLINLIPLLEAQASCEIENIVTTNDELFRAAHLPQEGPLAPAVKEALSYRQALRVGASAIESRPLHLGTAKQVCSALSGYEVDVRSGTGTYIGNPVTKERIYTPPEGKEVIERHMSAWEDFLHGEHDIEPLVAMALLHYQFEAIHPFADGNGRTGRIINLLYLMEKELIRDPVLYLSGYIVRHKDEYYRLLNAVTVRGAWEEWVVYLVRGVGEVARWTLRMVDEIARLQRETEQAVSALVPRAPAGELVRLLFSKPYVRIDDLVEAGLAQRAAASRWLEALAQARLLNRDKVGRTLLFVNSPLLRLVFDSPLV
ncbi:MAG: Fic/DOC family N-terminal domain-containing protein [Buchananella hordeovulneris]|nr:Fic/DOC family N-terminal domain-containing protein [Buchananella hordeovulneris]